AQVSLPKATYLRRELALGIPNPSERCAFFFRGRIISFINRAGAGNRLGADLPIKQLAIKIERLGKTIGRGQLMPHGQTWFAGSNELFGVGGFNESKKGTGGIGKQCHLPQLYLLRTRKHATSQFFRTLAFLVQVAGAEV